MPTSRNKPPKPPQNLPLLTPPPPSPSSFTFVTPVRKLIFARDLELFQASETHELLLTFVTDLNNSVINVPNSQQLESNAIVEALLAILDRVAEAIVEFPAEDAAGSRFGNKSFQLFYDAIWERAPGWHTDLGVIVAPPLDQDQILAAVNELSRYFCESFGNRSRIDYGSGHELNFLSWLLCIRQLSLLTPSSYPALVLRVFNKYLSVMRTLQTAYYLEPAGSHGVWGLDDYQFLPFMFGSAQLYSHPYLRPKSIHSAGTVEELAGEYMYLSCILFINSIKTTAGLRWHSPMLDDISAAKNWAKINNGMLKMYEKEVLGKLPVMQHFMFGGILKPVEGMGAPGEAEDREGMRHVHSSWGECCGIKVPASVAARRAEEGQGLRTVEVGRIPFD